MTMTGPVSGDTARTRVEIVAGSVPHGIPAEDPSAGRASSLDNLAAFVES